MEITYFLHFWYYATEAGRGTAFLVTIPGNAGTTGTTVKTLHCKRKRMLLMKDAKK